MEIIILNIQLICAGFLCAFIIISGLRRKDWTLQITGLGVLIITLILLFIYYPQYANVFSGMATVIVAIAAFISIEDSRRLREDNARYQSRGRTDKLCDEVLTWTMAVLREYTEISKYCMVLYEGETNKPYIEDEEDKLQGLYRSRLLSNFQALRDEGKYITKIARLISVQTEQDANRLWEQLTKLIRLLEDLRIAVEFGTNIPSLLKIDEAIEDFASLCNKIISETAKAKLRLIE
ncbi:MAG: hypothetical protein HYX96_07905 [Chloroflexi bacterium]|nr:hypothetical protein [Chloroflexota bacterium]